MRQRQGTVPNKKWLSRSYGISVVVVVLMMAGCGGGSGSAGGGGGTTPPASPDFALSLSPTSLSVQPGDSATASLSVSGSNGFSAAVSVQVSGLPTGVSVSPSSVTLTVGQSQALTFSASASAGTSSVSVTLTGSSGSLSHSATLALSVISSITSNVPPFRMRYARTDAATEYSGWVNSHWIVYNPPTSRFFVTDPESNRIFALDARTEEVVGTIIVPGAYGIDDTPDHTALYVGTQIGDVYMIDPAGMTVTKRYPSAGIGSSGFSAYSALVMADGRLALLGGQGGIANVDGYSEIALWNPTDNSISTYGPSSCVAANSYMGNIGVFTRNPDRTKVVIASIDSDGTLCEVDGPTGSANSVQIGGFIWHVVFSPDGRWIVMPAPAGFYNQADVYDASTLSHVARFAVAGDTSSAAEFFVGADSRTLYTSSDSIVYAYDLTTGQQTGWFPNLVVTYTSGGSAVGPAHGPQIQALNETGLLAGPQEEGVGFLDTTAMRTGAVGSQFLNGYLNPATGPTAGGTSTDWTDYDGEIAAKSISSGGADARRTRTSTPGNRYTVGPLTKVYVGSQTATSVSVSSGTISITTPPGAPGPTDVAAVASDGGVQYLPEAFSYRPTVLEISPNLATRDGGNGVIFGYGLGPVSSATSTVPIPSDLHLTVGGKAASITGFSENAYGITTPPFPLQAVTYTIPAGSPGTSDVTVTTAAGSTTVHNGMTYLPATQQFPLSGASLAQGIYDPHRDVYYFTDATKIQVFSRTQSAWLAPIYFPSALTPARLWGIALSPNGSLLAVADAGAQAIYTLDPDNTSAVTKFSVPQWSTGVITDPIGVAITNAGTVYFSALTTGGTGYDVYFKLNTNSGQVTRYDYVGTNSPATDNYLRIAVTTDNRVVYGNDEGEVFAIDTATDKVSYEPIEPGCCYGDYELSLSNDQTRLAATSYFYDANLHAESYYGLNLREMMNVSYVYGAKLSADGRLEFQPTTSGIDVFDGRLGTLLARIALPITLSPNYDALVVDGKDNVLVAITGALGNGVAVIDLSSITEPAPLAYEPSFRPARNAAGRGSASLRRSERRATTSSTPEHNQTKHRMTHVTTRALLLAR